MPLPISGNASRSSFLDRLKRKLGTSAAPIEESRKNSQTEYPASESNNPHSESNSVGPPDSNRASRKNAQIEYPAAESNDTHSEYVLWEKTQSVEGGLTPYIKYNAKGQMQATGLFDPSKHPGLTRDLDGLQPAIRYFTGQGLELVAFALSILRGEPIRRIDSWGEPRTEYPDLEDRFEALKWLTTRGYGKEPIIVQQQESSHAVAFDLSKLSTEELETYLALSSRAAARPLEIEVEGETVRDLPELDSYGDSEPKELREGHAEPDSH